MAAASAVCGPRRSLALVCLAILASVTVAIVSPGTGSHLNAPRSSRSSRAPSSLPVMRLDEFLDHSSEPQHYPAPLGGNDRFPYVVRLAYPTLMKGDFIGCFGVLVTPDVVVSAAHCSGATKAYLISSSSSNASDHQTAEHDGAEQQQQRYEAIGVLRSRLHPGKDPMSHRHDIMMYQLERPSTGVTPALLDDGAETRLEGDRLHVVGWGPGPEGHQQQQQQQRIQDPEVELMSAHRCGNFYPGRIQECMICASREPDGRGVCQGDSGGPIIAKGDSAAQDVVVGVSSWGFQCRKGAIDDPYPGVYSSVVASMDWIEQTLLEWAADDASTGPMLPLAGGASLPEDHHALPLSPTHQSHRPSSAAARLQDQHPNGNNPFHQPPFVDEEPTPSTQPCKGALLFSSSVVSTLPELRMNWFLDHDAPPNEYPAQPDGAAPYPYVAMLSFRSKEGGSFVGCLGALVRADVIVTAAHCSGASQAYLPLGPQGSTSTNGAPRAPQQYERIDVMRQEVHPGKTQFSNSNNLMIYQLRRASHAEHVALADYWSPLEGRSMHVVGWGPSPAGLLRLQDPEVELLGTDHCNSFYDGWVTGDMICASREPDGRGVCQGDSGGPMVAKGGPGGRDLLVGVSSWGFQCPRGSTRAPFPGVYSSIASSFDWVVGTMNAWEEPPLNDLCSPETIQPPSSSIGGKSYSGSSVDGLEDEGVEDAGVSRSRRHLNDWASDYLAVLAALNKESTHGDGSTDHEGGHDAVDAAPVMGSKRNEGDDGGLVIQDHGGRGAQSVVPSAVTNPALTSQQEPELAEEGTSKKEEDWLSAIGILNTNGKSDARRENPELVPRAIDQSERFYEDWLRSVQRPAKSELRMYEHGGKDFFGSLASPRQDGPDRDSRVVYSQTLVESEDSAESAISSAAAVASDGAVVSSDDDAVVSSDHDDKRGAQLHQKTEVPGDEEPEPTPNTSSTPFASSPEFAFTDPLPTFLTPERPAAMTPLPTITTPEPVGSTPLPTDFTPLPTITTPEPVGSTPLPTDFTPLPTITTPEPVGSTPLPTDFTPLPTITTPEPVGSTPLPTDFIPLPTIATPEPVGSTPLPTDFTPLPTITTPEPDGWTPLPTDFTPLPTITTPEPDGWTPLPTLFTPLPTVTTPEPDGWTPLPTDFTPLPTITTPEPVGSTPLPTLFTPLPTVTTPEPDGWTPETTPYPEPTFFTRDPTPEPTSSATPDLPFSTRDPITPYPEPTFFTRDPTPYPEPTFFTRDPTPEPTSSATPDLPFFTRDPTPEPTSSATAEPTPSATPGPTSSTLGPTPSPTSTTSPAPTLAPPTTSNTAFVVTFIGAVAEGRGPGRKNRGLLQESGNGGLSEDDIQAYVEDVAAAAKVPSSAVTVEVMSATADRIVLFTTVTYLKTSTATADATRFLYKLSNQPDDVFLSFPENTVSVEKVSVSVYGDADDFPGGLGLSGNSMYGLSLYGLEFLYPPGPPTTPAPTATPTPAPTPDTEEILSSGDGMSDSDEDDDEQSIKCRNLDKKECRKEAHCKWDKGDDVCYDKMNLGSDDDDATDGDDDDWDCKELSKKECKGNEECRWNNDRKLCLSKEDGGEDTEDGDDLVCKGLGKKDCKEHDDCKWDRDGDLCRHRKDAGEDTDDEDEEDLICGELGKRECKEKEDCKWDKDEDLCYNKKHTGEDTDEDGEDLIRCSKLDMKECKGNSGCNWNRDETKCQKVKQENGSPHHVADSSEEPDAGDGAMDSSQSSLNDSSDNVESADDLLPDSSQSDSPLGPTDSSDSFDGTEDGSKHDSKKKKGKKDKEKDKEKGNAGGSSDSPRTVDSSASEGPEIDLSDSSRGNSQDRPRAPFDSSDSADDHVDSEDSSGNSGSKDSSAQDSVKEGDDSPRDTGGNDSSEVQSPHHTPPADLSDSSEDNEKGDKKKKSKRDDSPRAGPDDMTMIKDSDANIDDFLAHIAKAFGEDPVIMGNAMTELSALSGESVWSARLSEEINQSSPTKDMGAEGAQLHQSDKDLSYEASGGAVLAGKKPPRNSESPQENEDLAAAQVPQMDPRLITGRSVWREDDHNSKSGSIVQEHDDDFAEYPRPKFIPGPWGSSLPGINGAEKKSSLAPSTPVPHQGIIATAAAGRDLMPRDHRLMADWQIALLVIVLTGAPLIGLPAIHAALILTSP